MSQCRYDTTFKQEVIEYAKAYTNSEAARKYSVPESTLRAWIKVSFFVLSFLC